MAGTSALLDRQSHPQNEQIDSFLHQLRTSYTDASSALQGSILTPFLAEHSDVKYRPGRFVRQCLIDAFLTPLPHVQVHHARPYEIPPKPPAQVRRLSDEEDNLDPLKTFKDLQQFLEMQLCLKDSAFVVSTLTQIPADSGLPRGLLMSALNNKIVACLDAAEMGPELHKSHWVFQDLPSTAIVWSFDDLLSLKTTFNVRFREVLVLQYLLFPTVPTDEVMDLELAAKIILGASKMTEWAARVPMNVDRAKFVATEKLQWLWIIARNVLRFMPDKSIQRALDRSKVVNNQRLGLGPKWDFYPIDFLLEYHHAEKRIPRIERLRLWRSLEALKLGSGWTDLFEDEALTAATSLPADLKTAAWTEFCSHHLEKLLPNQKDHLLQALMNERVLNEFADQIIQSTEGETLLSVSRSAGDMRCLGSIINHWRLSEGEVPAQIAAIDENYRFGANHIDCDKGENVSEADRISFSVFYRTLGFKELKKLLHRWCIPHDIIVDSSLDLEVAANQQVKARGSFLVCCKAHRLFQELTLVNMPNGSCVVLVRAADVKAP